MSNHNVYESKNPLTFIVKKSYYLKSQLDAKMCKRDVYEQPLKSISNQFLFGANWLYEYRLIGAGRTPPPLLHCLFSA
jgi:hypothetical protein